MNDALLNYEALLSGLKNRIRSARRRRSGEPKVIEHLAADLRREFPDMKGFSLRNLMYMRAFAEAWPEEAIVQQVAAQLPWFHNCVFDARQR